jgi:hypothetical protein
MPVTATNKFAKFYTNLDSPARSGFAIVPSDTDELVTVTRKIWVGTGGNLTVIFEKDSTPVTFLNVPNGTELNIMVKKVMFTDTDASGLIGYF